MEPAKYDVLIVGAGIAGSALAHALSSTSHHNNAKPLRIALLERSLAKPDRIVGELLQPGGIRALQQLGLGYCVEGIGAIPVHGYYVVEGERNVRVPYPHGHEGQSFHHGDFVMALRGAANKAHGVDVIEGTVTELVELDGRVVGVQARTKNEVSVVSRTLRAKLVVIADGGASKFRKQVLGEKHVEPKLVSHFVGLILEDAALPVSKHGNVIFIPGRGPVLLYQISERCTRMLVDVKDPVPKDLVGYLTTQVLPYLPSQLHEPAKRALEQDRLRRMPCNFLTAPPQDSSSSKPGVILIGDAWNMRHPLTGGGMTVALNDVVILRDLLLRLEDVGDWDEMTKKGVLGEWRRRRKWEAGTINMLSMVLYDMFGAADEELATMRVGCLQYFQLGGVYADGTISLLAGISHSPFQLFRHFFSVALYAIWLLFTNPANEKVSNPTSTTLQPFAHITVSFPKLLVKSTRVIWKTCVVFFPVLWEELRWTPTLKMDSPMIFMVIGSLLGFAWLWSQNVRPAQAMT
ncbi:hypothetical protein ONZ45_g16640 [Pleurotus djamor]|nr:hypothetical protein ONZ45_g16640 [Pleurotus djamor]